MEAVLTTETFGPSYRNVEVGQVAQLRPQPPLVLDCGVEVPEFPVAYQTYGELNADKSNAILVCHGLTGDQYAASPHPVTGKPGWWEHVIGAGKPLDTDRFHIIVTNVIGSCIGSFGPKSINPETSQPYGLDFPVITIQDMVRAQAALLDAMGIESLHAVVGGSMGGMQVLAWASLYPERVQHVLAAATAARHSAQNIALHEIGRQAIMADPEWQDGGYYQSKSYPSKGLAVARMTAHVTYMSEVGLQEKFGRALQNKQKVGFGFDTDFQVESYLHHQGKTFVERFDPNSYLYITRAMDYFDLAAAHEGNLAACYGQTKAKFCVVSFSSDWCFPTSESQHLVRALNAIGAEVTFTEIQSDRGHDAFLLEEPDFMKVIAGFVG